MSIPLPPVPQKTGHIMYAVLTGATWWIFSPVMFLLGGLIGDSAPAIGGLLIFGSIIASLTVPVVWIIKSVKVSGANRDNALRYQQQVHQYNSQFYNTQLW